MTLFAKTIARLPQRWPAPLRPLGRGMAIAGLVIALGVGYIWLGRPVTLVINDQAHVLRLHRLTVSAVVQELGLELAPEDVIEPPLETDLQPGAQVTIRLAQPVIIEADGRTATLLTQEKTVGSILDAAKIEIEAHDEILLEGRPVSLTGKLLNPQTSLVNRTTKTTGAAPYRAGPPGETLDLARPEPLRLTIRRAVPVTLINGRVGNTFYTTQATVRSALSKQGLSLLQGDQVTPDPDTEVTPGMEIYIDRATPVSIVADGQTLQTRTRRQTVGEVLAQAKIPLMGQDFSRPAADQPISANDTIEVVRVREALEIQQDFIPFETSWVADETMELDRQEVRQPGTTGVVKTRSRVRYENGQEVARQIEDEWLDQVPNDRVIAYGTNIVVRTLDTPDGPVEYWRRISMVVTAYNATVSGKDADHPRYGITRSGLPAGFGRVAVDAKVIPLMTDLYVPGYGMAVAADTGGRILGKHLDLGYDEDQPLPILYEWRDVYLLTPVPSANQIRYVLPQWPQQ